MSIICSQPGTAGNGREGFSLLSRHHEAIDLVLTDINMPKMSGLKLITRIRQAYPALHVLVMTGFDSLTMNKKLFQRNVIDYLKKPFSIAQLTERLEYALDKRQPQGFQGKVQVMGLTEIVQLYCMSRATVALTVVRPALRRVSRGVIYFENGMITHALCGEKLAQAAFFYIMGWPRGAFSTSYGTAAAIRLDADLHVRKCGYALEPTECHDYAPGARTPAARPLSPRRRLPGLVRGG